MRVIQTGECFFAVADNEKDTEDEFAASDLDLAVSAEPGCFANEWQISHVGLERRANLPMQRSCSRTII